MKNKIKIATLILLMLFNLNGCKKINKAGTYEDYGNGRNGKIKVSVTINSDGEISDIELLEHEDNKEFVEKTFKELKPKIIEKNSTDVDVSSGATQSSEGILEAVEKAVEQSNEK
ncbi:FMN-binding protein [Lagierella sp. ICN-221743]